MISFCARAVDADTFCNTFEGRNTFLMHPLTGSLGHFVTLNILFTFFGIQKLFDEDVRHFRF